MGFIVAIEDGGISLIGRMHESGVVGCPHLASEALK